MPGAPEISSQKEMESLIEAELRSRVIMPLLPRLGIEAAYHNHGPNELGKDIVGWMEGPQKSQIPYAFVVKRGKVSGEVAEGVADQINKAFNTTFRAGTDDVERKAHYVWVISSGAIPPMSKDTIKATIGDDRSSRVVWTDGDQLWKLWNEHFPVDAVRLRNILQARVKAVSDEAITAREWVEPDKYGITVSVKDATRLTDRHTQGSLKFQGDDSAESVKALADLQRFFNTGESVTVSGKFVKLLLPGALDKLLRDSESYSSPEEFSEITLSPVDSEQRYPVRFEILCDDGDQAALQYVDWRILQGGTEEITFINDQQSIPVKLTMVFATLASEARYHLEVQHRPVSAYWTVRWMDIQRCLSKPGRLRITSAVTALLVSEGLHNLHTQMQFHPQDYEFFKEIEAIEHIVGQPIHVPEEVSGEDARSLDLLRRLLRNPVVGETWTDGRLKYEIGGEDDPGIELLVSGKEIKMTFTREAEMTLLGSTLYLGEVRHNIASVKLADQEKVRTDIVKASQGDIIEIEVRPESYNTSTATYRKFVDTPFASQYRNEPIDGKRDPEFSVKPSPTAALDDRYNFAVSQYTHLHCEQLRTS